MSERDDADHLLRTNLEQVFNERDAAKRRQVIERLYTPDATVADPEGTVVGHAAIDALVTRLLSAFPPGFRFVPGVKGHGHHQVALMPWTTEPEMLTGFDVAQLSDGRIHTLHVFID